FSGFGRLLFAIGDNSVAARLAGVRVWAVLLTLYILSALLAAAAGALRARRDKDRDRVARGAVGAAGGGGVGHRWDVDPRRPGRLLRHDHRRARPGRDDVIAPRAADARGRPPGAVRPDHRHRRRRVHARHRRDVSGAPALTRHLGIDLGATNLKWSVLEHDGAGWRGPARAHAA